MPFKCSVCGREDMSEEIINISMAFSNELRRVREVNMAAGKVIAELREELKVMELRALSTERIAGL